MFASPCFYIRPRSEVLSRHEFQEDPLQPITFLSPIFLSFFPWCLFLMCLSLVYLFIKVYWFAEYFILVCIHWSSWDSQQVDPSRTLSLNCDPPSTPAFYRTRFSGRVLTPLLEASPRITTFASAQDPPGQTPVGPIVLISRLALFALRGHVHLGPFQWK